MVGPIYRDTMLTEPEIIQLIYYDHLLWKIVDDCRKYKSRNLIISELNKFKIACFVTIPGYHALRGGIQGYPIAFKRFASR